MNSLLSFIECHFLNLDISSGSALHGESLETSNYELASGNKWSGYTLKLFVEVVQE